MMKRVISLLLVLSSISSIYSQNTVIQGKVIADCGLEPLIGVTIIANDSINLGVTRIDGCFLFETPLSINKLSFLYVGMETADLKISDNCNHIELIMIADATYDFMSFRKVNKIRRKIYKKLPRLHQEAYEKGIFQSPEVCYIQEFSEYKWVKE